MTFGKSKWTRQPHKFTTAATVFCNRLFPYSGGFYNEISSQNESADLIYKSHLSEGALLPQLKANRHKDLILGYTSRGIHRDDMDMMLGEYPMKRIGSQDLLPKLT